MRHHPADALSAGQERHDQKDTVRKVWKGMVKAAWKGMVTTQPMPCSKMWRRGQMDM
jgi:hypothetical protein